MSATTLAAHSLAHRYGARAVLPPMDLALEGPGVVAVIGANGSGKSTLLRILAGLQRATAGRVELVVDGQPVKPSERRRHVGLAAPDLEFYEEFSALENLRFAADARALPEPARAVEEALVATSLPTRARDRVGWFSSGMKQRLRIAFAILHAPAVLMLDEPGGHLDDDGRTRVEQIVRNEGARRLVLIATNDPREAALAGRRVELHGRGLGDPS